MTELMCGNDAKGDISECVTTAAAPDSGDRDSGLVHAARDGDMKAFEELVKRYDCKLLRVACHITHNREDAEEAVQEAFLKAFTKLEQFEENAKFSTWLTRIVVNESLMKLRTYRATNARWVSLTEQDEGGVPFDVADWAPNPEQLCSATELRGTLIRSLEGLSPALRVVFVLRDVAGLSGEEAGDVLGLTSAVIKARLFRARLQLRERLTRYFRLPAVAERAPHGEPTAKELARDSA